MARRRRGALWAAFWGSIGGFVAVCLWHVPGVGDNAAILIGFAVGLIPTLLWRG